MPLMGAESSKSDYIFFPAFFNGMFVNKWGAGDGEK